MPLPKRQPKPKRKPKRQPKAARAASRTEQPGPKPVLIATTNSYDKSDIKIFRASSLTAARAFVKRWNGHERDAVEHAGIDSRWAGRAIIIDPDAASDADTWRMGN